MRYIREEFVQTESTEYKVEFKGKLANSMKAFQWIPVLHFHSTTPSNNQGVQKSAKEI